MQKTKCLNYQVLFLNWLDQYHRNYFEVSDVLQRLQYLKDKLTEYIYETTVGEDCLKSLNSTFLRTKLDGIDIHLFCAK